MGGSSKKSGPKPPDFTKAAELTAQSSREATNMQNYANRPTQNTPQGQTTWDTEAVIDPATGQRVTAWTQNTTLTPELQAAEAANQQATQGRAELGASMMGRVQDQYAPEIDYSQYTDKGAGVQGGRLTRKLGGANDYMGQAGDALMSQFDARMTPEFARQEASHDTILRNRGLNPGDEAYDTELAKLRQGQGDQRASAMYQAQQLNAQEAMRLQGMDKTSKDFLNDAIKQQLGIDMDVSKFADYQRSRDITEDQDKRARSLNEMIALMTGQQVAMPQMPNFQGANRAAHVDYSGAANDQFGADMQQQSMANAATAGMIGAITSPFSIATKFS